MITLYSVYILKYIDHNYCNVKIKQINMKLKYYIQVKYRSYIIYYNIIFLLKLSVNVNILL